MGDEGYPYGLPIDHWYCEEKGKLYFHCGKQIHEA
jgi:nitroimidazol reductase NimA-like FMN-containing flavoprotein (pyridoxamine 5'-phosphate oxidase superfamily)